MKSFSKSLSGLVAILLLFALCVHVTYTGSPHQKFKTEQTSIDAKIFQTAYASVNVFQISQGVAAVVPLKMLQVSDVPKAFDYRMYERVRYSIPVNDDKPDNTNYQLIRFEQMPLSKITYKS